METTKSRTDERQELVEEIGLHFEKQKNLPPLAARILALLLLSPEKGIGFEEITATTRASKSSVSTGLNLLLQLRCASYYTKPGDRKRYFKHSKLYLERSLKEKLELTLKGIEILEKITRYNNRHKKQGAEDIPAVRICYKECLIKEEQILRETLEKISKL